MTRCFENPGRWATIGIVFLVGCQSSCSCPRHSGDADTDAVDSDQDDSDIESDSAPECVPEIEVPTCLGAAIRTDEESMTWRFDAHDVLHPDPYEVSVSVEGEVCRRRFTLTSTQAQRDTDTNGDRIRIDPPPPREVEEIEGRPSLDSGDTLFDALYAQALDDLEQDSVEEISDGSYEHGAPFTAPDGGFFQTGKEWTYVWTRDVAYSIDLGLALLDPLRSRNTLEFKTSERRDGTDRQVIQDTGTGGSYPISTDRVAWALGAARLLPLLEGEARESFAELAYETLRNTVEQDRAVIHDTSTGLYRGETSFLDWRQQTYPGWTVGESAGERHLVHIGLSQSLSTNTLHLRALELVAEMSARRGDDEASRRYTGWADELREALREHLALPDGAGYSAYLSTTQDPAPVRRFDLLGSALAVLTGVATEHEAREMVAGYPHLPLGAPVIWPQQQRIDIYHNRAIWPFVTAYWLKAAMAVRNDRVVSHNVRSLLRGASLNLSNMENLFAENGLPWWEESTDGATYSGPVINSQRQLWSVAGYLSMVHDVIFGLETSEEGIRFRPYITRELRHDLFSRSDSLVLNNLPYRGRTVTIVIHLPEPNGDRAGAYQVGSTRLNGCELNADAFIPPSELNPRNLIEIQLIDRPEAAGSITLVTDAEMSDYSNIYGPFTPEINSLEIVDGHIRLTLDRNGEDADALSFRIYRDGQLMTASPLPGTTTGWIDMDSSADSPSHCYVVESEFVNSGNFSQHSLPRCFNGTEETREIHLIAHPDIFTVGPGGRWSDEHERPHYADWGTPGDELRVEFTAFASGTHLFWALAGNGHGPAGGGITCVVKRIDVEPLDECEEAPGGGYLIIPHMAPEGMDCESEDEELLNQCWNYWGESSTIRVDLRRGCRYRVTLRHDEYSINMSVFERNTIYSGRGGEDGPEHHANIAEIRIRALSPR